ncbi:uncharacterized protein LOC133853672 [Alnus glutinosa]|uniref:uncharacterized protein LOC133853672 n=1 Tax=Alnus glutinosa TaxID=3517 RepID=UPI002D7A299E|nr:uncharacterized protein LOC133853672 [Alnus glutinosa]
MADEPPVTRVQNDIDKLIDINKKQEEQIRSTETKAIQLTNLYFVFQGVILTSISSASPVKCHNSKELDQNYEDLQVMRDTGKTRAEVNAVVPGSSPSHQGGVRRTNSRSPRVNDLPLPSSQSPQEGVTRPKPDSYKQWKRCVLCYAAMALLAGFSGIILYGCHALLCDTPKDKCVKLC